ncbi:MAG: ABC transporter permease [Bacteroidota bacterium]
MLQHYIKVAFRNFSRQRNSFLINLVGLSTGLACALIIFLWVNDEYKVDHFLENDENLYRIWEHQTYADEIMTTNSTPGPLADAIVEDFPEIEYAATVLWGNWFTLFENNKGYKVVGRPVGKDFLKVINLPMAAGDRDVLEDLNSLAISESTAIKMYGSAEQALGKMTLLDNDSERKIGAVFTDFPDNSTLDIDLLIPFDKYRQDKSWLYRWGNNGPRTYIRLKEGVDYLALSNKIKDYVETKVEENNVELFLKPYAETYLHGRYENGAQVGGRIEYIRLFSAIAIFILLIACINFMNLSTARASRRAKEVGVKKAVGAQRNSLIGQYLSESIIIALISLFVSVGLVHLFLPQFNEITDKSISLEWSPYLFGSFLGITLFAGLLAGSYPAFYLSSFEPVTVLKGTIRSSWGELWARRGLVIFQFTLSIVLIVAVTVVYQQIQYVQSKNLGYKKENLIRIDIEGNLYEKIEPFLEEAKKIPGIVNVSSIGHNMIGRNNNTSGLEWEGKNPEDRILFENITVNYDLLETVQVNLKEGRFYSREYGADTAKIIFNEAAIKVMGMQEPLGKVVRLWEEHDLEIIGVIEDFHFESLHEPVNPAFFLLRPGNVWAVMASLEAGKEKEALMELESIYDKFNPGFDFQYDFMDEQYAQQYQAEQRVASLSKYFASFAILISCLGLFGLAAFTAERKKKEIGIRKVLGASVMSIVTLLTKDFTRLVMVAILLGLPIAWWIVNEWLGTFAYHIDISIWYFALAGLLVLTIAWLTVGSQAFASANVNPRDCFQDE